LNTRAPLVDAGEHGGTVVHVYGHEGAPCTRLSWGLPITYLP